MTAAGTTPAGAVRPVLRAGFDDSRITQHLLHLAALDAGGWTDARREIGEYFVGEIQDCFDEQKLADGSPMPQSKAAIARSGKTLIRHHHLYDSYVYQLVAHGLEVGSDSVYAALHHFGGQAGRGRKVTLPARPVMGMTPRHEAAIGNFLIAEINRGLQA